MGERFFFDPAEVEFYGAVRRHGEKRWRIVERGRDEMKVAERLGHWLATRKEDERGAWMFGQCPAWWSNGEAEAEIFFIEELFPKATKEPFDA